MTWTANWEMYGVVLAALALVYQMFRNLRSDLNGKFDKIDGRFNKIDEEFKEVRQDIAEIKERISFLEAANIYTMPIEPAQPSARSLAAMEMWKRRRQKKLDNKQ